MQYLPRPVLLVILLMAAGCQTLGIQDVSALPNETRQQLAAIPIFSADELAGTNYQVLQPVVGYSCRHYNYEPDAREEDAREQMRLQVLQAGGNAAVLTSCVFEGTSLAKDCWNSYTCTGVAALVDEETVAAAIAPAPAGNIGPVAAKPAAPAKSAFPSKSLDVRYRQGAPRPHDIAVVIGNADYGRRGQDIPDVVPAHADAEAVRDYLVTAQGFREGNIIFMKDATAAQMIAVFGNDRNHKGQLHNWVKPNKSRVFVYYSGHGAPAGLDGSAYLVPADASANAIELTGFPLSLMYRNLEKIPAKSITVVLEACFSGGSQGGSLMSNASPVFMAAKLPGHSSHIQLFAAGKGNQIASWEKDRSHGLFTKYYLLGQSGEADKAPYGNGDGRVGEGELRAYLEDTLTYYARRYYGRDQTAVIQVPAAGS